MREYIYIVMILLFSGNLFAAIQGKAKSAGPLCIEQALDKSMQELEFKWREIAEKGDKAAMMSLLRDKLDTLIKLNNIAGKENDYWVFDDLDLLDRDDFIEFFIGLCYENNWALWESFEKINKAIFKEIITNEFIIGQIVPLIIKTKNLDRLRDLFRSYEESIPDWFLIRFFKDPKNAIGLIQSLFKMGKIRDNHRKDIFTFVCLHEIYFEENNKKVLLADIMIKETLSKCRDTKKYKFNLFGEGCRFYSLNIFKCILKHFPFVVENFMKERKNNSELCMDAENDSKEYVPNPLLFALQYANLEIFLYLAKNYPFLLQDKELSDREINLIEYLDDAVNAKILKRIDRNIILESLNLIISNSNINDLVELRSAGRNILHHISSLLNKIFNIQYKPISHVYTPDIYKNILELANLLKKIIKTKPDLISQSKPLSSLKLILIDLLDLIFGNFPCMSQNIDTTDKWDEEVPVNFRKKLNYANVVNSVNNNLSIVIALLRMNAAKSVDIPSFRQIAKLFNDILNIAAKDTDFLQQIKDKYKLDIVELVKDIHPKKYEKVGDKLDECLKTGFLLSRLYINYLINKKDFNKIRYLELNIKRPIGIIFKKIVKLFNGKMAFDKLITRALEDLTEQEFQEFIFAIDDRFGIDYLDIEGNNLLHKTYKSGKVNLAEFLIEKWIEVSKSGLDINLSLINVQGKTPIDYAMQSNPIGSLKYLLNLAYNSKK